MGRMSGDIVIQFSGTLEVFITIVKDFSLINIFTMVKLFFNFLL